MKKYINKYFLLVAAVAFVLVSCEKEKYSLGAVTAPSDLALTLTVVGKDAANPNGDGTGKVNIISTSKNALSYTIDYGDGTKEAVQGGSITHKYSTPGTNTYTITVNAVGTGGAISTVSKQVTVLVNFEIPANIMAALTGGSSKVWQIANDVQGHFGVGRADMFWPNFYDAPPNTREACAYDDELTFTKTPLGQITLTLNNKGQSMSIGAATAYYGFAGGDGCYPLVVPTTAQTLIFSDATSASTPANSTRIKFKVPGGKGILAFGTGGTEYEILSISSTQFHVRNIGADGNSWYQIFKLK